MKNEFKALKQYYTMECQERPGVSQLFQSVETVQVLFYLERYNPNVTISDLSADLGISGTEIGKILKMLLITGMIKTNDNDKNYILTEYGRVAVKALHSVLI